MKHARTALLATAALAIAAPASLAQATGEDEIIITGQKTPRSLQDTQASVGVITGQDIADKGLDSFRDAFRVVAGVIDADWVDAGFVIRGVNSEGLTPGGAPLASVYIDGAAQTVQGARRGARGLWDVEQVEIYRGPQSTLSGRASLAGAIYVQTRDPSFEWDAAARLTVGENDLREGAIAFGGPLLGDAVAFRIAGEYSESESDLNYPLYEQYSRFDDFITDEYYQVRGKLLFAPSAFGGWRGELSYSFAHDSPTYDDIAGPGLGFDYSERRGDLNAGTPVFQENRSSDNQTAAFELTRDFGENLTFTSLTAFGLTDVETPSINEGTPGETDVTRGGDDQRLVTQEFRLNHDGGDVNPTWVLGLYIADEENESLRLRRSFGRFDTADNTIETRNYAVFGEMSVPFAEDWTAIMGGRLDFEEQTNSNFFSRDNDNPAFSDILISGQAEDEQTTFLPKVGLVWDFADNMSIGATFQRGFRSGGVGVDLTDGSTYTFDPEYTSTYEIAFRSRLFDDSVTLNANVFYTDWSDQQVELQLIPGDFTSNVTLNAGQSMLYGGELEVKAQLAEGFDTFLAVGYVQTEFEEFVSTLGDFSGSEFPESPAWTISAGFDWDLSNGIFIGADARHVSSYLARDIQNTPADTVGDYVTANLRIGYRAERWSLTAFADNIFDEEYFVYRDVIGTFDCCGTLGERRLVGVTLEVNY